MWVFLFRSSLSFSFSGLRWFTFILRTRNLWFFNIIFSFTRVFFFRFRLRCTTSPRLWFDAFYFNIFRTFNLAVISRSQLSFFSCILNILSLAVFRFCSLYATFSLHCLSFNRFLLSGFLAILSTDTVLPLRSFYMRFLSCNFWFLSSSSAWCFFSSMVFFNIRMCLLFESIMRMFLLPSFNIKFVLLSLFFMLEFIFLFLISIKSFPRFSSSLW